jgi:hypothetical protein
MVLRDGLKQARAACSAYMLKPRGKVPKRFTPDDYVNRGKKLVLDSDHEPPRRSTLRRMRNDEDYEESEEEEEEEEPEARMKLPPRRGRAGRTRGA